MCRLHWWALTGVPTLSDLRCTNSVRLSTVQSGLKLPTNNTDPLFLGGPAATNFQLSSLMTARIGWLFSQFDCTGSGSTKPGPSVRVRVSCCAEPEVTSGCPDCCPSFSSAELSWFPAGSSWGGFVRVRDLSPWAWCCDRAGAFFIFFYWEHSPTKRHVETNTRQDTGDVGTTCRCTGSNSTDQGSRR